MKSSNSRVYFKGSPSSQIELDKTQSKFNRRQPTAKELNKKYKSINKEDQKICYMSPQKINMLLTSPSNSIYSSKSPASSIFLGSPAFERDELFIQNNENDLSDNCKMSDSLLSIYNQLDKDSKNRQDASKLREEVSKLTEIVAELTEEKSFQQKKLLEMNSLEEFLMQRQTYICKIHEENIQIVEKNAKLVKQKQLMYRENDYLRKLLQKEKDQHQADIKVLKNQCEKLKDQKQKLTILYQQLQQSFNKSQDPEDFDLDESGEKTVVEHSQRQSNYNQLQVNETTPFQLTQLSLEKLTSPKRRTREPLKRSYKQLLSSRSGKFISGFNEDEQQDSLPKSKVKDCGCRVVIDSLYQKIRYNQIQIDILKRVKVKGESYKEENQKLKRQNSNLHSRIQYITERKREKRRRKNSDSSLQFSLSPSKGKRN